jgi:hypothetical protein
MIFREATLADIEVFALEHDGSVLCVGGFKMLLPGCICIWCDLSAKGREHLIFVYRSIKEWIGKLIDTYNLHRVMAWVHCEYDEGKRLVEHLGFSVESVMKNFFGPGKDALLYVILPEVK